jgi:hypothetical protein
MPYRDTGWTMDTFIEFLFGSERVYTAVTLVEEVQRVSDRLVETPADEALRRALRHQLHDLRESADANRWVMEGDLAATLTDLPVTPNDVRLSVQQVRAGLQTLHRLVQKRLAHVIALHQVTA